MIKRLSLLLLLCTGASQFHNQPYEAREVYKSFLENHPYSQRERLSPEDIKEMAKQDRPDLAWEQNYLSTLDPALGRPAPERLLPVYQQVAAQRQSMAGLAPGSSTSPWVERGPDNVGGRTRALMWDPNAASGNKVWAGGVTGGLWYNNDISSSSTQWIAVNDFWDNISITAIAYDPTNTNTFYAATGEGWGAGAARGEGIWKSTDAGQTWTQLSATTAFYYINDLVVRNEGGTGVVYAACRGNFYRGQWHGSPTNGLQRSTDGGNSWTQVLPNVPGESISFAAADIEVAADNRLWVGTTTSSYGASDRGGGRVLYSDNGTSWTISHSVSGGERVELACAPGDANYVYALTEINNQAGEIARTTNKGSSWTAVSEPVDADNGIPNTDFTRGQAWYDLILAVDPNNANIVLAGGIDLFRSTDGGNNWAQISKWSNNNNLAGLSCALVHADQHAILFKPGSSSTTIFGTDGGVYHTSSLANAATSSVINARNNGYNVTQYYACAMHPTANTDYYLAGSQDNGTQQYNSAGMNSTVRATGGDGAYCFIDQTDPTYQATSYVYNSYWRSTSGGAFWGSFIQNDQTTGKFINPADYDDQQNVLYSARTSTTLNRISNFTGAYSIDNFSVSGMNSMASHLRVSPYTTSSSTLFVGTDGGDLYKVTNAESNSPGSTNIGSNSFPNGNISCVELGANENEILVTFSNYGVTSVWYTSNGGTTWVSKEGNLPDMPVRWALFNPNDRNEVILATEVGVWSTSGFNAASPAWSASNSGLANVRVDMLQIRDSDKQVIAATHGRGLFSSNAFGTSGAAPIADFSVSDSSICAGAQVIFTDLSTNNPTSWNWAISPGTYLFVNSTSATSQNPEIQFTAAGTYDISLTSTNASGNDTETKTAFVSVATNQTPTVNIGASNSNICQGESVLFTATPVNAGSNPTYQWKVNGNNVGSNSTTYTSNTLQHSDAVSVELTSSANCAVPAVVSSNSISMNVSSSVTPAAAITATSTSICQGEVIVFTANINHGGTTPAYQWKVNGINAGTNHPSFVTSSLQNGDVVNMELSSNANCLSTNTALSNSLSITVTPMAAPSVAISATDTSICQGGFVSFTATPTNGGTNPSYQWKVNGNNVGFNSSFYSSSNLNHNDVVTVELTSSSSCAAPLTALSSPLTMQVVPVPVVSITTPLPVGALCPEDTLLLTANYNSFGRQGIQGPWIGPGVQGNRFIPSLAGPGTHTIVHAYAYLWDPICTGMDSIRVTVDNIVTPTITQNGNVLSCNQAGFSYLWLLNGTPAPGTNNAQQYTVTGNGVYRVRMGTANCSADSDPITINNFSLEEFKKRYRFSTYPNPATHTLAVSFENPGAEKAILELYAFSGARVLYREVMLNRDLREELLLNAFAAGMYTLKVRCGDVIFIEKVEKL